MHSSIAKLFYFGVLPHILNDCIFGCRSPDMPHKMGANFNVLINYCSLKGTLFDNLFSECIVFDTDG